MPEMSDEDGFFLGDARIVIVGLGLMGGSLALALKGKCAALYGVDPDRTARELALCQKIVSQADEDPANILPQADVIILAAPVPAILDLLLSLPKLVPKSCVLLDLGSTKVDIVTVMSELPARFDPIGGHPICGKERLSIENAEAGLYRGAPFALTRLARTSARARSCAEEIIRAIGAHPVYVDAPQHDCLLASTSHLPFLIASALTLATSTDSAPLTGSGFRSASRLTLTPSSMMLGVLQSNRENILKSIHRFQAELHAIESLLATGDFGALETTLNNARAKHQELVTGH
jgi:prephenate dehydrogenase